MVCCHTELSMQMAEVSWVWYCVTFVAVGGNVVIIACWKDWRLSASLSSPHEPCMSCLFVIGVPVALVPDHWSGSCCMSVLMWVSLLGSASMSCSIVGIWDWVVVSEVMGGGLSCSGLFITVEGL